MFIKKLYFFFILFSLSGFKPIVDFTTWSCGLFGASFFSFMSPNFENLKQKYSTGNSKIDCCLQTIFTDYLTDTIANELYKDYLKTFGESILNESSKLFIDSVDLFSKRMKLFSILIDKIPELYKFIKNKSLKIEKTILISTFTIGALKAYLDYFISNKIDEQIKDTKFKNFKNLGLQSTYIFFDNFILSQIIESACISISLYFSSKPESREFNKKKETEEAEKKAYEIIETALILKEAI
jgi:hypothetical protein